MAAALSLILPPLPVVGQCVHLSAFFPFSFSSSLLSLSMQAFVIVPLSGGVRSSVLLSAFTMIML